MNVSKNWTQSLWFNSALLISAVIGAGHWAISAYAEPGFGMGTQTPRWASERLGRVWFSYKGDQRKGEELKHFQINEDGVISGEELLNSLTSVSFSGGFDPLMPPSAGAKLERPVDQAFAQLILNRILDHEAMKHKMATDFSPTRDYYVLRAVLTQNAVNQNKIKVREIPAFDEAGKPILGQDGRQKTTRVADEDASVYSNDVMYGWLKEVVGNNPVRFNMNWAYLDGGLDSEYADFLRANKWPAARLEFMKLPETWQDFLTEVHPKLLNTHRNLVRLRLWNGLVQKRFPDIAWQRLFANTTAEYQNLYDALKDSAFAIHELTAGISEVRLSGAKSADFLARLKVLSAEKENLLMKELFESKPGDSTDPAARQAMIQARLAEARSAAPIEILDQLKKEFAEDIASGAVTVSLSHRELGYDGVTPLPKDDSTEAVIKRVVFSGTLASMSIIPTFAVQEKPVGLKVVFIVGVTPGEKKYVPISDLRVQAKLRALAESKVQGRVFRELAYQLFKENPFEASVETCSEKGWKCANLDPRNLAETLFPEIGIAGVSLGQDGPGNPIRSTLGRPELMGKILGFKLEPFMRVMELPNNFKGLQAR